MGTPIEERNACVAEKYQAYLDIANQEEAKTFLDKAKNNGQAIRDCFSKQPKARHQELTKEIKRAQQVIVKSKFYQGLGGDGRSDLKIATRSMLAKGEMPPEPLGFWTTAAIVTSPAWVPMAIGLSPLYFIFKGIAEEAAKNKKVEPPTEPVRETPPIPPPPPLTLLAAPKAQESWFADRQLGVRLLVSGSMDSIIGPAFGSGVALNTFKKVGYDHAEGPEVEYLYANNFHDNSSHQALATYHWVNGVFYNIIIFDLFAGGGYVYTDTTDGNHHGIVARVGLGAKFGSCTVNADRGEFNYCIDLTILQANLGATLDGKFLGQFQPQASFEMTF